MRLTAESVPGLEVSFSADCGSNAFPNVNGGCTGVTIGSEVQCSSMISEGDVCPVCIPHHQPFHTLQVTITATVSVTECTERLINGTRSGLV